MKKIVVLLCGVMLVSAGLVMASGKAHWGYSGHEGPSHWGELSKDYELCGTGKNQSPIDLIGMIEADLEDIQFNYTNVPLEVLNNGHAIQVNYAEGSTITINGQTFSLKQFHFHSPSENHVNGRSFPLEAHLVHADGDGNLAVVTVMFEEGEASSVVGSAWEHMPEKAGQTNSAHGTEVNVMNMLPQSKEYYRFNGSLTTPPCTEGVLWLVLKNTATVSKEQVEKFHNVMHHDNNRPIQRRFARPVLK